MNDGAAALPKVPFGAPDLAVTRLCQGTAFRTLARDAGDRQAEAVLRHCLDAGVRFFDSSNAYGWGGSEELLGRALEGWRDGVVVCTKVSPSLPPAADGTPGARVTFTEAFLREQLEGSLRRLRTDRVDLYLLHQPDGATPPDAVCARMQALLDTGRVRHWGVSNHGAALVQALLDAAAVAGTVPPVGVEDYYTVAGGALTADGRSRVRQLEREMFPLLRRTGLGLLAFSPMDCGALAPGRPVEAGSPLAALLAAVDAVAAELGSTRGAVCVAWMLAHGEVTSVLGGAESPAHVDELIAGTALALPGELVERLTRASVAYGEAGGAHRRG